MKKIYYFLSVITICFSLPGFAQRTFTPAEKNTVNRKADSIIRRYEEFSQFTRDVDEGKILEEYVDGFRKLFVSPEVDVINDLDYSKKTPTHITVSKYIEYVRQWYPAGMVVVVKIGKKNPIQSYSKNNYQIVVSTRKEMQGMYKDEHIHSPKTPLNFVIQFNDLLTSFKIAKIEDTIGNDKCKELRDIGKTYLAKKDYKKAKTAFSEALTKYCPSDEVSKMGIITADSGVEANKKPISFVIHLLPGYSMFNVTIADQGQGNISSLTSESGIVLAGGLGIEAGLFKSSAGLLSVGLTIDYGMYTNTLTTNHIDEYVPEKFVDIDNDPYNLIDTLTSLKEEDKISYLQIPLYVKYDLSVSKALSLYGKLGIKASFVLSKDYTTTVGTGTFMGEYPGYDNIILWGNELSDYGYGTYSDLSSTSTNSYLNSINLSALVGLGLKASLSKSIDLFLGIEYAYGFSNIANRGSGYSVYNGDDTFNSLYGASKASLSAFSLDLGINIRLTAY